MVDFEKWVETVHKRIIREPIWQFNGYKKARYFHDLIWEDTDRWRKADWRSRGPGGQVIRSVGSISANLEEGYGRGYGKELLYFYRVALASARETKGWIYRSKRFYSPEALESRLKLCDEVISLLVDELNRQKNRLHSPR